MSLVTDTAPGNIIINEDFQILPQNVKTPNLVNTSIPTPLPKIPKEPRKVKDGVDILNLQTDKPFSEIESSLELILVTLCQAFNMKPK